MTCNANAQRAAKDFLILEYKFLQSKSLSAEIISVRDAKRMDEIYEIITGLPGFVRMFSDLMEDV